MCYCFVPYQSIYRLAIFDISALKSLVLLTSYARFTVNHDTYVVLLIEFTRQLLNHRFAILATKSLQVLLFFVCHVVVKAIFVFFCRLSFLNV